MNEDLGCPSAEMIYGGPLLLPEYLLAPSSSLSLIDLHDILNVLRTTFCALHTVVLRITSSHSVFVSPHLFTATHVFVRWYHIRPHHVPPHDGPYNGLARFLDALNFISRVE